MSFSKNQQITIVLGLIAILTTIWGINYTNSPDLLYTEFNPPDTISNSGNNLRFELTNYGEKTGTYFISLSASSDDIKFSRNHNPSDDYENNISLHYKLGTSEDVLFNFKLKSNNSTKNSNVTVTFIYIDASPWILKKEHVYKYNYKLNNTYLFNWEDIPGNDSLRLIDFLKEKYNVDWVKPTNIRKNNNIITLKANYGVKYILLSLNNEKTKTTLKFDDGRTDEFIVKNENNKLNIYTKNNNYKLQDVNLIQNRILKINR